MWFVFWNRSDTRETKHAYWTGAGPCLSLEGCSTSKTSSNVFRCGRNIKKNCSGSQHNQRGLSIRHRRSQYTPGPDSRQGIYSYFPQDYRFESGRLRELNYFKRFSRTDRDCSYRQLERVCIPGRLLRTQVPQTQL